MQGVRWILTLVAALALSLALIACGGSDKKYMLPVDSPAKPFTPPEAEDLGGGDDGGWDDTGDDDDDDDVGGDDDDDDGGATKPAKPPAAPAAPKKK